MVTICPINSCWLVLMQFYFSFIVIFISVFLYNFFKSHFIDFLKTNVYFSIGCVFLEMFDRPGTFWTRYIFVILTQYSDHSPNTSQYFHFYVSYTFSISTNSYFILNLFIFFYFLYISCFPDSIWINSTYGHSEVNLER